MLRIRRISDAVLAEDAAALGEVQAVLRRELPLSEDATVDALPRMLADPVRYEFKTLLLVADDLVEGLRGFVLASYTTSPPFAFLDRLYSPEELAGRGVEEALYQRLGEHLAELEPLGIFAEARPDDPKLCRDRETLQRDVEQLIFLEKLGLRPIVGTAYEHVTAALDDGAHYLLFHGSGEKPELSAEEARAVIRILLEAQHGEKLGAEAIAAAVESVTTDPVAIRPPRYTRKVVPEAYRRQIPDEGKILLVSNDHHGVLAIRRRGNVEMPARILAVLREAASTDLFARGRSESFPDEHVTAVHGIYYRYLEEACSTVGGERVVYPSVFPRRHYDRVPDDLVQRLGYYCVDVFTPLNAHAFRAAREAADCALTAAERLRRGERRLAYALVRPPGHHAETASFGGYCYLNSSSIAAHYLSGSGRVAIVDLDFHHGNGHQDIFFSRRDVLTVSIHRDPRFEYPFYAGFEDEIGEGEGRGFNRNFPLERDVDGARYREVLGEAITIIEKFGPDHLVVALGLDPARLDPLGTWTLGAEDFRANGRLVGALGLPTLVVQEGGYNTRNLGRNACHFFAGLWEGAYSG